MQTIVVLSYLLAALALTRSVTDECICTCTAEKCVDYCSLEAKEAEGGITTQGILQIGDLSDYRGEDNGTKCPLWHTEVVSNGSISCNCDDPLSLSLSRSLGSYFLPR